MQSSKNAFRVTCDKYCNVHSCVTRNNNTRWSYRLNTSLGCAVLHIFHFQYSIACLLSGFCILVKPLVTAFNTVSEDFKVVPRIPQPLPRKPQPQSNTFQDLRFGRQVEGGNFNPSPRDNIYLDQLIGQWIPGKFPSEFNWKGINMSYN